MRIEAEDKADNRIRIEDRIAQELLIEDATNGMPTFKQQKLDRMSLNYASTLTTSLRQFSRTITTTMSVAEAVLVVAIEVAEVLQLEEVVLEVLLLDQVNAVDVVGFERM